MKIAIISDIHDHVWNLQAFLQQKAGEADVLLCCGDLCSPFIISMLGKGFQKDIHVVFGNNDADQFRITQNAFQLAKDRLFIHSELAEIELDSLKIAVNHYPNIAKPLFASGKYDLVCYGHNHQFHMFKEEGRFLLNPGPLMGYDPSHGKDVPPTFILFDTSRKSAQGFQLIDHQFLPVQEKHGKLE
ncbi:metallophosphoesterase family protein [Rapidithrix thailandica]|uniref:Phosphoesterase n=1 Tax=Rapidithrix thailandica TaxID=413964 RepID=A0AAW9S7D6_9BACT